MWLISCYERLIYAKRLVNEDHKGIGQSKAGGRLTSFQRPRRWLVLLGECALFSTSFLKVCVRITATVNNLD